MSTMDSAETTTIYDQVVQRIFSGDYQPGSRIREEALASSLGVSRVPVRESLAKLAAQGMLIGGDKGQGVRLRKYTLDEVRHLYEYRELLEGGAARAAATSATSTDLARLEIVCEKAEQLIGAGRLGEWAQMDMQFHLALALAGRNDRIVPQLKTLVVECGYLFFVVPNPLYCGSDGNPAEEAAAVQRASHEKHCTLLDLIRRRLPDEAEAFSRQTMRDSLTEATSIILRRKLDKALGA